MSHVHTPRPGALPDWMTGFDQAGSWLAAPDPEAGGPSLVGIMAQPMSVGAMTQVLYLTETGDTAAISVNDIHQGQIGDCFLLASIGELAMFDPVLIARMIHANSNGTETVTLYEASNGRPPGFGTTSFKAAAQTVTNSFPTGAVNNGATQDVSGGQKEIWVQVLEKAYAQANGGYPGIQHGGNPCIAMEELTGHVAIPYRATGFTAAILSADLAAGDLIVMDTANAASLPYHLVGNHAYMFDGVQAVGGVAYARMSNPWGFDQPSLIPIAKLGSAFAEVDIGHTR